MHFSQKRDQKHYWRTDQPTNGPTHTPSYRDARTHLTSFWWAKTYFLFLSPLKFELGPISSKYILFIHAFLGCDTTSWIYVFGKSALLKKIQSDKHLMQAAQAFLSPQSSSAEIQKAGEQATVILCNRKPDESLNGLWYKTYNEKVATNVVHVQPQVLPPTEAAKKFHSFRVFY